MIRKVYKLVNQQGETTYQGSLEECREKEIDKLVYVGTSTPIYRATNDNGLDEQGTMDYLSKKLNVPILTLYNYTRFKRNRDGLYVEKVSEQINQAKD